MKHAHALGDHGDEGILFFGGYDPDYPRNAVIRKGLKRCGFPVSECRVDARLKVLLRYPALLWRWIRAERPGRIVFVPDFRHKDVPLAWALARVTGRTVVFDPLVSRYETRVLDRGDVAAGTYQSWHNRNLDALSLKLADLVITDTASHARFYAEEFGVPLEKMKVLPVGFDEDIFRESSLTDDRSHTMILFYGTYLPLHGVETIVAAAGLLSKAAVRFMLVGEGQTYGAVKDVAAALPDDLLAFHPAVSSRDIARLLAEADIVLGIFGTTPKAAMVVPNKVFQALAVGRPVVTADTPAIRELFTPGAHLLTVPAGDPRALADAIELLIADGATRRRLARDGGAFVRAQFNSRRIAERFLTMLREGGMR
jgi:glycosyltransferase involved in cell wall biosynthesis